MSATPERHRWAELLIEAALLAAFLVVAVAVTAILEHPMSPARRALANPATRRSLAGLAMGLTAAGIIYSPWGRRSGAHINPAVTLAYLRLGKIAPRDALRYVLAQFAGAACGVSVIAALLGGIAGRPEVNYAATVPGAAGIATAFIAEGLISFGMMTVVLVVSNGPHARYTGACAAALVAIYITIEAPISGMSMNPARSLAPAIASGTMGTVWIYFVAPLAGMLGAAEVYVRLFGAAAVRCAKLHHAAGPCHFRCSFESSVGASAAPRTTPPQMPAVARQP